MESFSLSMRSTIEEMDSESSSIRSFNYQFYWNASNYPFDPSVEKLWKLFDKSDQCKLNEDYEKYLKNNKQNICYLKNYKVDFDKFIQINISDESKIRPIKKFSLDIKIALGKLILIFNFTMFIFSSK